MSEDGFLPDLSALARVLGGEAHGQARPGEPTGYAIDSRALPAGGLFFALPGERTDGHRFLGAVHEAGAWGAVVSDAEAAAAVEGLGYVVVADVAEALMQLALARRERLAYPFVAITGTNGKTSTKDMVATALGTRLKVARSPGNFNNQLGCPLAILAAPEDADVGVLEVGMSTRGEIDRLGALVRPRYGVITNVAEAHLETLGSLEEVREAKAELVPHVHPEGTLYLNGEDPSSAMMASRSKADVVRVSAAGLTQAEVVAHVREVTLEDLACEVVVDHPRKGRQSHHPLRWPVPGRHMVYPLLFAVAIARDLGLTLDDAFFEALVAAAEPTPGRMRRVEAGGVSIIDDAYNANPRSVAAALDFLAEVKVEGRRYCVLGDMLELGPAEGPCHRAVAERVQASRDLDASWLVGEVYAGVAEVTPRDEVAGQLLSRLEPGDVVLVKGSRGIGLDHVVRALVEGLGGEPC